MVLETVCGPDGGKSVATEGSSAQANPLHTVLLF